MGFFVVFPLEIWDAVRPKYPQKIQNSKHLAKKGKRKNIPERLRRGTLNTCKIAGSISQKRRGYWTLKEFGVLCLNQPVGMTVHGFQLQMSSPALDVPLVNRGVLV